MQELSFHRKGQEDCRPKFLWILGNDVALANGKGTKAFDENYVRTSILNPQEVARSVYESASAMPSYQGRLKENQISALIEFMKTLK